MKVALDTNVLLSAVFTRGVCEALLDVLIESDVWTVVLSEHILDEFREHAGAKFGAPAREVERAVAFVRRHARIVEPVSLPIDACRDPDDLPVLGTAIAGGVDALVTGDADLLDLKRIGAVAIMSPRVFYDRLE